tara:strand:+ start:1083 stop:1466 length:384 start_codon:yes stop_codon:yes gene_type:complete
MTKKKSKYDRRRAIDCELLKKSETHKGYCKYLVTIAEKDGTIHKQPAYGKDMQDALSRLLKKELTVKVEKKIESNTGWIFISWLICMGWPTLLLGSDSPKLLIYGIGSVMTLFVIAAWWYNHIKKGE